MIVKADSNGCGDLPALLQLYECCGVDGAEVSGIDFNRRAGQKTPFYLDALYRKRFVRCVQHQDEIEQFKTIPW